jgi:hypothetical protein
MHDTHGEGVSMKQIRYVASLARYTIREGCVLTCIHWREVLLSIKFIHML